MPKGSFSGDYDAHGEISDADAVIAQDFGIRKNGPGVVNEKLAGLIDDRFSHLPILTNEGVASALQTKPTAILEGNPSTTTGGEQSTWRTLQQARVAMAREGLKTAIVVGQALHEPRIDAQAKKLGISTIVPEGLPKDFDPESLQWWTRNQTLWIARESLGLLVLRLQDRV